MSVTRFGSSSAVKVLILSFTVIAGAALAQPTTTTQKRTFAPAPVAPAPANPGTAAPAAPGTAAVSGFRSAHFGMAEADVRKAIERDFRVRPDAIHEEENKAEQTHVLTLQAADVLPGGGTAAVSYVFGYKSKSLIQVAVSWSKASDDKMNAEQLFSNANVLRAHFLSAGYKPDTVATNMPVNGGVLLFRGNDAQDHTTLLILQGTFSQGENNQRVLTPTGLTLFYIADAKSPDVYRLPPGSF
jgi:hypothetical protein